MTVTALIAMAGLLALYATTSAVLVVILFLAVAGIERYFHVR